MENICTVTFTDNENADAPFEAEVHLVRHVGTEATTDGLSWDLADSRDKGPAAGVKLTARAAARLIGGTWNIITPAGDTLYGGEIEASDKAPRTRDRRALGSAIGPVSGERRNVTGCVQVRSGRLFLNLGMPKLGSTAETGLDWD
jgi:hypothetical protein